MKQNRFAYVRLVLCITISTALLACGPPQLASTDALIQASPVVPTPASTPVESQTDPAIYLSPSAFGTLAPSQTTIAVRYFGDLLASQIHPSLFTVIGDKSGMHVGTTVLSDDQRTVIFRPAVPFTPGESVSVQFAGGLLGEDSGQFDGVDFTFGVSSKLPALPPTPSSALKISSPTPPAKTARNSQYVTAPATVPVITVTHYLTMPTTGEHILLNTSSTTDNPYLLILDETGGLVYYKALPAGKTYGDFTRQPDGRLTYFEGVNTAAGGSEGIFNVLDSSYNLVDSFQAGNGYAADSHEFLLLPDGHALMTIYDYQTRDMSAAGGKPNAAFIDLVVQELDRAKNVVFQWKASEHVPYTETYESLTGDVVDPYHGNSIDVTPDGSLLISLRHMSQVVKVDRHTGDVIWRMGGKESDFTFTNDIGFSYQHDVRSTPDDHLTLFDNGNHHVPQVSRAIEYAIDDANMTVTRIWAYSHTPVIYGSFMGDTERLQNGNTFIGWGGPRSMASEISPDDQLVEDLEVGAPGGVVYRWFMLPWQGNPDTTPTLVAKSVRGITTLYFSWNGATEVAAYRVETGQTQNKLALIATQNRRGFETTTTLSRKQSQACYYRVTALDKGGHAIKSSDTVRLPLARCGK